MQAIHVQLILVVFIAEHIGLLLTNGQICQQSLAAKKKTLTFFSRSDSKS